MTSNTSSFCLKEKLFLTCKLYHDDLPTTPSLLFKGYSSKLIEWYYCSEDCGGQISNLGKYCSASAKCN